MRIENLPRDFQTYRVFAAHRDNKSAQWLLYVDIETLPRDFQSCRVSVVTLYKKCTLSKLSNELTFENFKHAARVFSSYSQQTSCINTSYREYSLSKLSSQLTLENSYFIKRPDLNRAIDAASQNGLSKNSQKSAPQSFYTVNLVVNWLLSHFHSGQFREIDNYLRKRQRHSYFTRTI